MEARTINLDRETIEAKLHGYIERRRKEGRKVEIIKHIYDEGLKYYRCVLSVDGIRTRMWFNSAINNWRKS